MVVVFDVNIKKKNARAGCNGNVAVSVARELHVSCTVISSTSQKPNTRLDNIYCTVQSHFCEGNWFLGSQKIPRIFRNPDVNNRIGKSLPPVPILSHIVPKFQSKREVHASFS